MTDSCQWRLESKVQPEGRLRKVLCFELVGEVGREDDVGKVRIPPEGRAIVERWVVGVRDIMERCRVMPKWCL